MEKKVPDGEQPPGGGQKFAAAIDIGGRFGLWPGRVILLCRSASECGHGRDSNCWAVSQSGEYSAARRVWQGSRRDPAATECGAGAATRGDGAARRLPGGRGGF